MCLEPREPVPETRSTRDLTIEIVDDLATALVNARIYRPDHPRVLASAESAAHFVAALLPIDGEQGLRLSVANDVLVHRGDPLLGASFAASRLIQAINLRGAGGIELDRAAKTADVAILLAELAARPSESDHWQAFNERLERAGCRVARLLPPFVIGAAERVQKSGHLTLVTPMRFYQSCVDVLQEVTISICHGGRIEFGAVQSHAESVLRRLQSEEGPLMNLARQDQYDAFTFGHSVRVAVLAMNFARALTDDQDLLIRIGTAALLHDCGKSLVPFEILHSRKPLSAEERREMSKHPAYGAEILLDHELADPLTIATAFGHHRSCDGKGYPATLGEHHNLLVTELVKICDVYEALTAARPYKQPMSPVRAYRVMMSMGAHLDRRLLRLFIENNGIFPVGQLVRLKTGELARVVAQSAELMLPRISVEIDFFGYPIPEGDRELIDLSDPSQPDARQIQEALTGASSHDGRPASAASAR